MPLCQAQFCFTRYVKFIMTETWNRKFPFWNSTSFSHLLSRPDTAFKWPPPSIHSSWWQYWDNTETPVAIRNHPLHTARRQPLYCIGGKGFKKMYFWRDTFPEWKWPSFLCYKQKNEAHQISGGKIYLRAALR